MSDSLFCHWWAGVWLTFFLTERLLSYGKYSTCYNNQSVITSGGSCLGFQLFKHPPLRINLSSIWPAACMPNLKSGQYFVSALNSALVIILKTSKLKKLTGKLIVQDCLTSVWAIKPSKINLEDFPFLGESPFSICETNWTFPLKFSSSSPDHNNIHITNRHRFTQWPILSTTSE